MAKVNVNRATRDELVDVAGLRPQVADAILKLRDEQGGRIAGLDALRELRGVGDATIEQLRDVLSFGAKVARETGETTAETMTKVAREPVETTAETTKKVVETSANGAAHALERTAEVTPLVTRASAELAQKAAESAAEVGTAVRDRSSQGANELGQVVIELVSAQIQANVEALQALARARTWNEAIEAQSAFYRGSMERMTQGASRYVQALTRLSASMAQAGNDVVRKAA